MKHFLFVLMLAGCAEQPPTVTHFARMDGLRGSAHPWTRGVFQRDEAICRYQVSLANQPAPDFIYPAASSDLMSGAGNLMRGQAAYAANHSDALFNQCMGARGYYIERVD